MGVFIGAHIMDGLLQIKSDLDFFCESLEHVEPNLCK